MPESSTGFSTGSIDAVLGVADVLGEAPVLASTDDDREVVAMAVFCVFGYLCADIEEENADQYRSRRRRRSRIESFTALKSWGGRWRAGFNEQKEASDVVSGRGQVSDADKLHFRERFGECRLSWY